MDLSSLKPISFSTGVPSSHFQNPVLAGIDIVTVTTVASYWAGIIHTVLTPVLATASLGLSALWYGYCLYEALEKRFRKKHELHTKR